MIAWQTPKFRPILRIIIIILLELFLFFNLSPQSDFSIEGCFPKEQACARLSLLSGNYSSNPREAPLNAPSSMSHRERALHRDSPSGVLDALRQGLSPFNPQVIAHNFTVGNDCRVNNALVPPLKLGQQGDKFYIALVKILELYNQGGNIDDIRDKLEAGFPKGVFKWNDAELEGIEGLAFRLKFGEERRYSLVDKDGTITIIRIDSLPPKVELTLADGTIQVPSTQGVTGSWVPPAEPAPSAAPGAEATTPARAIFIDSNIQLNKRSLEIRNFCKKVYQILEDGLLDEVRNAMYAEIPDLKPINNIKEPIARLLTLFNEVARIVKETAGHDFDLAIYPCSGSDITAVAAYSNNLITIDDGDLFAIYNSNDKELRERLKSMLRSKLVTGMHGWGGNQGLVAYAMELFLLGVDLDSLNIIKQERINSDYQPLTKTVVKFKANGRTFTHTNFGRAYLRQQFDISNPHDVFLRDGLVKLLGYSRQPVVLSKAGGGGMLGENIATTSLYHLLREGAVVVSDSDEQKSLSRSGATAQIIDLKTDVTIQELAHLQETPPPTFYSKDFKTDPRLEYGYAIDLRDLTVYRLLLQQAPAAAPGAQAAARPSPLGEGVPSRVERPATAPSATTAELGAISLYGSYFGFDAVEIYKDILRDKEVLGLIEMILTQTYSEFLGEEGREFISRYFQILKELAKRMEGGGDIDIKEIKSAFLRIRDIFNQSPLPNKYYGDFRRDNLVRSIKIVGTEKFVGHVVDVGADDNMLGFMLHDLCPSVTNVTGVDIERRSSVKEIPGFLTFKQQKDPTKLSEITTNSADTVVLRYSLHHMTAREQISILNEAKRICKPAGRIIIYEDTYSLTLKPSEVDDYGLHNKMCQLKDSQRIRLLLAGLDTFSFGIKDKHQPFPFTYKSIEEWTDFYKELGFIVSNELYFGIPIYDLHQAPLCIFVLSIPENKAQFEIPTQIQTAQPAPSAAPLAKTTEPVIYSPAKVVSNLSPMGAAHGVTSSNVSPFTKIVQRVFRKKGYIVDNIPIDSGWRCLVYRAIEISTSKVVAIKIADPYGDPLSPEMCQAYCKAMRGQINFWHRFKIFNHNFLALVQLYDAGFIPTGEMQEDVSDLSEDLLKRLKWDYHYQIMEYVEGKNLEKLLRDNFFLGKDISFLIDSLVEFVVGLDLMHQKGIAHGELLSKNVIVDKNMKLKASDLDPMRTVYEGKEKDCRYLRGVVYLILSQASMETTKENIITEFFAKWSGDTVAEKGLKAFAQGLMKLKAEIEPSPIPILLKKIAEKAAELYNPNVPTQCVDATRWIAAELDKLGIENNEREIFIPHDCNKETSLGDSTTSHTILEVVYNGDAWVIDTQLLQLTLPERNKLKLSGEIPSKYVYPSKLYYEKVPAFSDSICGERITKAL